MERANALRLMTSLPEDALVLDVGGGAKAFPRADWVLDLLRFEDRNWLGDPDLGAPRYSAGTWVQWDVCDRRPFPFPDRHFDYSVCSHLLEDVRDPVWVCSELQRVSKAGYVETPSRVIEQTRGVENPMYCGYSHHRWLVNPIPGGLSFQFKLALLHACRDAWVTTLGVSRRINPRYEFFSLEWQDSFEFREHHILFPKTEEEDLVEFAGAARRLPELTVGSGQTGLAALERWVWWQRLKIGRAH